MSAIGEAAAAKGILAAPIAAGVNTLSQDQVITFVKYLKFTLISDGSVFWVKAASISPSALLNTSLINTFVENQIAKITDTELTIQGSLHYATEGMQDETETYDRNRVIFTALAPVETLNQIDPQTMYIGEFDGLKFAWSSRGRFYKQADTYHYVGDAVYSTLSSQIIDDPQTFQPPLQVVSNSLPLWLSMNFFETQPWFPFAPPCKLYPSYLSPLNLKPPYITVHVDDTEALASTPTLGHRLGHHQLCSDRVRITMYGLTNETVMQFVDFVNQFTEFGDLGIMSIPVARDDKKPQNEILTIAMKKTIDYRVSYLQTQVRDLERQLINKATLNFVFPDVGIGIGYFAIGETPIA